MIQRGRRALQCRFSVVPMSSHRDDLNLLGAGDSRAADAVRVAIRWDISSKPRRGRPVLIVFEERPLIDPTSRELLALTSTVCGICGAARDHLSPRIQSP